MIELTKAKYIMKDFIVMAVILCEKKETDQFV